MSTIFSSSKLYSLLKIACADTIYVYMLLSENIERISKRMGFTTSNGIPEHGIKNCRTTIVIIGYLHGYYPESGKPVSSSTEVSISGP